MGADASYLEGANAATDGQPLSGNPYADGSEDSLSWIDGWNSVAAGGAAYGAGADAAKVGRPLSGNPYEEGSEDYQSWIDGFNSV